MASLALLLLFPSTLIALVATNWRGKLLALFAQYVLVVLMVAQSWPLGLSSVKGVAGFVAVAILAYTRTSLGPEELSQERFSSGMAFKLFAFILLSILVYSIAPQMPSWIPSLASAQAIAGLLLIGAGLVHIALDSRILPTIVGLLTLFSGFELIYAAVEVSTLLAGLLALINLAIALVGALLLLLPTLEPAE